MSILSAIKQQNSSIDDLAALPQAMIMQMAQKKQISEEMLAPILARKAEMADAFARQNALQGAGQTPPTVMEQLMAQNAQAEQPQMPQQMPQQMAPMQQPMPQEMPQDMGVGQLPIPERQYAGGGIIAFADGGMSDYEDDDYEDSLEEADYNSMIERAMNAGEDDYTPTFETRHAKGSPQSFPNTGRDVGIASVRPQQDGDIRSRLLSTIMQKESGGKRHDKHGNLLTSPKGAEGEMQVMRYTARDPGFGVKPAQNNSPDELKRVGDDYAMAMYNRYKDPKLAMIAYNMGPGATDKWLASGADPRRLPRETQGYISGVNLAHGGEVQHFASKGYVEENTEYDPFSGMPIGGAETYIPRSKTREIPAEYFMDLPEQRKAAAQANKNMISPKVVPPKMPPELQNVPVRSNTPTAQEFKDFDQAAALFQAENMGRNASTQAQETPKSRLDQYMEKMLAREAAMEARRGDDKNMALLTAGLGILGGTSPYAMANIGQGALAGVQNLREADKQRAAEQSALDKSMLYATRYQGVEDLAKQNALYNRGVKQQQYNLDVQKLGTEQQKIAIGQYETHINNAIKSLDRNPLLTADPVARAAAEEKILNSPTARSLYKRAYGDMGVEPQKGTTIRFDSKGKQIAG
jgi:hypothetical protein